MAENDGVSHALKGIAGREVSRRLLAFIGALLVVLFGLIVVLGALSYGELRRAWYTLDFGGLDAADSYTVFAADGTERPVTDPVLVRDVVEFVKGQGGLWEVPWEGLPVGSARVELHTGEEFMGSVGLGDGYLLAEWSGGSFMRTVSAETEERLLELLGLTKADALSPISGTS